MDFLNKIALPWIEFRLEQQVGQPQMALSGVRISWLMFAKKSDFMRAASSPLA